MTEKYLHYIWRKKRISKTDVITTDGECLSILDFGTYNENLQGPDFKMASIQFGDVTLFGHVEIHINSSDWYRHKHDKDSNYDNVILHVVSNHDKDVYQNDRKIPTIELEVDHMHYRNFRLKKLKQLEFPCSSFLEDMDAFYFEFMKQRALTDKLNSKIRELRSANLNDGSSAFYHLIGLAFGSGLNKEQFKSILMQLPYTDLNLVPKSKRYNLVMTMSGVIQCESSERKRWHYKGTRPQNSPRIRVDQFAFMVANFDFNTAFDLLNEEQIIDSFRIRIKECWMGHGVGRKPLSNRFVNHLIINSVVPYLWFAGDKSNNQELKDKALEILALLPGENNNVIRKWKGINVQVKTAFDSQGLLALYRYYCCHKKCLSCDIGTKILNR